MDKNRSLEILSEVDDGIRLWRFGGEYKQANVSGGNSTTKHYILNNEILLKGGLVFRGDVNSGFNFSVSMRNYDDETPQIVTSVTALAGNISETGTQQTFTVALSQEPVTSVVLQLAVDNDEALLNISNLTFTPTTYSTPVTVIVSGVDDSIDDGDQNFVIKISPVSGTGYVNASPVSITGTNTDND